jgi:hypothetical protein
MRLIPRHRHNQRAKAPRIAISQEEISADLHYRGGSRPASRQAPSAARQGWAR